MNSVSPSIKEQKYFKEKIFNAKKQGIDLGGESLTNDMSNLKIFCWRSELVNKRYNTETGLDGCNEI